MCSSSARLTLSLLAASLLAPSAAAQTPLTAKQIASGLQNPIWAGAPAGDDRIFIALQPGVIKILKNGVILGTDFLAIQPRVGTGSERGLLGAAFHPDYANNGYIYIDYTDNSGTTVVSRWTVHGVNSDRRGAGFRRRARRADAAGARRRSPARSGSRQCARPGRPRRSAPGSVCARTSPPVR